MGIPNIPTSDIAKKAEKEARKQAIMDATKYAVEVPFSVMQLACDSLDLIRKMAEIGNPNSVTENTEIGRATEFAQRISKTHCYIDESDKWHIFNGNIWKEENKKFLHAEALEFFEENASEISIIEDERDRNDETREFQRHANRSSVNNLVLVPIFKHLAVHLLHLPFFW